MGDSHARDTRQASSTSRERPGIGNRSFPIPRWPGGPAEIAASGRMVKERQMRWTPRDARLPLQVRTRVLNDRLAGDFRR